jgi:hypothetical protein
MSKHTPGPWRIAPASDYADGSLNVDADTRGYVCLAGFRDDPEARANARLIAAAPDLLEACKRILADIDSNATLAFEIDGDALEALDSAITKAEGPK